uniref:Uncharacterized protein n=1 Tax=Lactuca sativa TaxID=4236 RepID=A0A9R1XF82_LACSA|nr:hypothetical protein LSAT_V11C500287820 [Lactuca sativa]
MQRAIGMCINGEDSVQKRKWTDGFSLPVLFHHLFLNFRILRMLPPETIVGPFKPNLIWKPTSPKELSSHVMGKTEENFFYQIIFIFSPRILKQSREITSDFHPFFSSTCLLSPKSTPLTGDGHSRRRVLLSSELIQIGSEERLLLITEILFKNLDLDMKDRVRKIEGNPDFCCFISTKYCKSRMLPMVMDKARIRNSEYSGLNNASESLKHAMQLVIGICIN